MLLHFGDVFWFAAPRTPPLWQRGFFLVDCFVLRRLLASVRSGVVKTFRCAAHETWHFRSFRLAPFLADDASYPPQRSTID